MSSSHTSGEMCLICEETKENGIHILHQFICQECEEKIVAAEPNDPYYQFYLQQLRKLKLVNSTL
ncbi:sigma factor G inhibitor Gin [Fictibacillus sp. Mic-4]|uniref:sigma factor G inhibitor Gin n=1 Tax=Fictibacillus TaxID=1329200 RepID=UPI00047AD056|nr:sigma factor G inhibitor Gin [Fictibacillus gelatini]